MQVRAFAGVESGWSKSGTNAAFIVSFLRWAYGDDFTYADLLDFVKNNTFTDSQGYEIETWEPRSDLLADGVLVGWSDGQIYIPEGFSTTGWSEIYPKWKSGQSIATLPQKPSPPPPPPPPPVDDYEDEYDDGDYEENFYPSAPQPQPSAPVITPAAQPAPAITPAPTAVPIQPQVMPQQKPDPKKSDSTPLLIGAAVVGAFLLFGSKKKGRR